MLHLGSHHLTQRIQECSAIRTARFSHLCLTHKGITLFTFLWLWAENPQLEYPAKALDHTSCWKFLLSEQRFTKGESEYGISKHYPQLSSKSISIPSEETGYKSLINDVVENNCKRHICSRIYFFHFARYASSCYSSSYSINMRKISKQIVLHQQLQYNANPPRHLVVHKKWEK